MNDATTSPVFPTTDPGTLELGRSYPGHSAQDAANKAARAAEVQKAWRRTAIGERARLMRAAGAVLRSRRDELAALMTSEMGKTVADGRAEIDKCASACDHFAAHAAGYLARQPIEIEGTKAFVAFNPLGVVLAVMPWNFPFWQVFRFAAPALMAGNGGVLKHASNVPGCALAIESVFKEAGFPEGLFATVLIKSSDVKALIEDASIAAVTLTGSVPAGRSVATIAGGMLKKCVLELGGADAYLVLEDAAVAAAAKVCAAARMVNAGQSCIAGKRFIVVRSLRAAFEAALVEAMRHYEIGDPRDPATKLGALPSVAFATPRQDSGQGSTTFGDRSVFRDGTIQRERLGIPAAATRNLGGGLRAAARRFLSVHLQLGRRQYTSAGQAPACHSGSEDVGQAERDSAHRITADGRLGSSGPPSV